MAREDREDRGAPRRARGAGRPTSLKRRITRDAATLVILVLVAMGMASTVALRSILDQEQSLQLRSAAERAQELVRSRAATVVSEEQIRAATPRGSFVLCLGAGDRVLVSNLPAGFEQGELLARVRAAGPGVPVALSGTTVPVRAALLPLADASSLMVAVDGQPQRVRTIVIGFDTSPGERLLRGTALLEGGFTAVAGAVIVLLLPRTIDSGLRGIRAMTDAARAVAAGDVGRRLPADADVAEAVVLAHAVNDALDARQDAEARLRQFVADASHELRTPLTTIEGWAELHRQGGLEELGLVAQAMDRIADSAAHLTALVDDLALLARLDAGRPIEHGLVDVAALAETVVEDIRVIDPTRPVTLSRPVTGDPAVVVQGDEQRLRQVLLNLTGNALQHTPAGTPLEVDVRGDGAHVTLTVSDRGPGVPAEHRDRIFDRFYRGSASRSTGGNGLGLAIVRSLVDAHGGAVDVTSGSWGSRFTVVLPAPAA